MNSYEIHVCREQEDAPSRDGDFEDGSLWTCVCGNTFVHHRGFTRSGRHGADWWEVPPVSHPAPQPVPGLSANG